MEIDLARGNWRTVADSSKFDAFIAQPARGQVTVRGTIMHSAEKKIRIAFLVAAEGPLSMNPAQVSSRRLPKRTLWMTLLAASMPGLDTGRHADCDRVEESALARFARLGFA